MTDMDSSATTVAQDIITKERGAMYPNLRACVRKDTLKMSDNEVLDHRSIKIYYVSEEYAKDIDFIVQMSNAVQAKHPYLGLEDIDVCWITESMSEHNARKLAITASIPAKEFLKMRKDGKITYL
jgi:hypothetical protein